jgi:two-component system nitrogen regulation response regulator GlnG
MLAREEFLNGEHTSRDESDDPDDVLAQPLVLVADDDSDFRATLVKTLARLGLRVAEVESGSALIAALGSVKNGNAVPDLVITDNHMPGCSGLTALAIMQEAGLDTPVILMTGYRDNVTESRAHRYGAVATLRKPFDVDELRETIARALIT